MKKNLTILLILVSFFSYSQLRSEMQIENDNLKSQLKLIIKQRDSLLLAIKSNVNNDLIVNPKNELDSIKYVIQNYYNSTKWEDRIKFVLKPILAEIEMNKSYKDKYKSQQLRQNKIFIQGSNFKQNDNFVALYSDEIIYLKKVNNEFKIDWFASNGFNPLSLLVFSTSKSVKPTEFRVNCKLAERYPINSEKDYQNSHWNIRIEDKEYTKDLNCYVSKKSELGEKIYHQLGDGKLHQLILEIKFDPNEKVYNNNFITLTKLIKENWTKE